MTTQQHTPTPSYDTRKHIKCLVHDCTNYTDEGGFIGALCVPCYRMVTTQNARRACNAHDSLKAGLLDLMYAVMQFIDGDGDEEKLKKAVTVASKVYKDIKGAA